ncbi:MAG: heavy metal translocating P-type ATPase, partial [Thermodesulfobacteriota bacterium]
MPTCEHCLIPFPSHRAVTATFGGSDKVFCCHACLGVYEMIHTEHLEAFYRKRSKWAPGPVVRLDTDPALFAETVRTIGEDLMEVEVQVGGIRCASCVWLTEKVLEKTHGIREARVNYATHRARIRWVPSNLSLSDILRRIANVGYQPRPLNLTGENQFLEDERRRLLTRLGTALFFSMQLMLYSAALYAGYFYGMPSQFRTLFHLTALVLATPVFFYSGWPFLSGSWRGLKQGSFNMDVLITAGSGSAYLLSIWQLVRGREVYFDTCAMIITLVLLGRYIEFGAKKRSTEAISRLLSLVPGTATRLVAGTDDPSRERSETVPVESVRVGDVLDLRPGNRIPVDGCVTWGTSEVDESMLTGESRPVVKTVGNDVFAGTVNRFGAFRFRVTAVGRNTALSRIVSAVQEAQSRWAPIQKLADRITGYFVPLIVLIALFTFTGWWISGRPAPEALMAAISVMVIACPCALGLATPLAILVGTGRAADSGII